MNNVEEIKDDYYQGLKYKDIQEKHNITYNQLIYLIQKNKWKRPSNRSNVQKGNKNAKGNKGGHAPKNNKNALTTGEYENIFSGFFSEEEKSFFDNYKIPNRKNILYKELKMLMLRESRILTRIDKYEKGKDMSIMKMTKSTSNYGTSTTTDAENNINIIHKLEEALTRVQDSIRKITDSLNKIDIDNTKIEIEKAKLEIEKKRLELELQNLEGEEIEDLTETDSDIYGSG